MSPPPSILSPRARAQTSITTSTPTTSTTLIQPTISISQTLTCPNCARTSTISTLIAKSALHKTLENYNPAFQCKACAEGFERREKKLKMLHKEEGYTSFPPLLEVELTVEQVGDESDEGSETSSSSSVKEEKTGFVGGFVGRMRAFTLAA